MAATSGMFALSANNVAQDVLNHLTPNSGTVATAITVTGPIKGKLLTTTSTNQAEGTECADANYTAGGQAITWGAAATTAGAGFGVGYVQKQNSAAINYPQGSTSTGFAAAAALTGMSFVDSTAVTPIRVFYWNFAATVNVPQGNVYQFAVNALSLQQS